MPLCSEIAIFSTWCQDRNLDPVTSNVSVVLSFLREMLDKQRSSSTIKDYTPAIAALHAPIAGRSVGRDSAVTQFLRGVRRMGRAPCLNHCNPRASKYSRLKPPWEYTLSFLDARYHFWDATQATDDLQGSPCAWCILLTSLGLIPCESWFRVVSHHSTAWLNWFLYLLWYI